MYLFGNLRDYTWGSILAGCLSYSPVFFEHMIFVKSNFINIYKVLKRKLSINHLEDKLDPHWVTGFVDAEGCFNVSIKPRLNTITGYRVSMRFVLDQKNAESTLLHIKDLFGFGQVNIRKDTNSVYRYSNDSNKGLLPISNYFLTYSLKTKKFNLRLLLGLVNFSPLPIALP